MKAPPVISPPRSGDKAVVIDGIVFALIAVAILAFGWFYPNWYLDRDLIMRHEQDSRIGPGVLFAFVTSFVYAWRAAKRFGRPRHARP